MAHSSCNQWQSSNHWEWTAENGWQWQGQQWSWSDSARDHEQQWWQGQQWRWTDNAAALTPAVADAANNAAAWTSAVADTSQIVQFPDGQQIAMPPAPPGVNRRVHFAAAVERLDLNYFLNYRAFTDDYQQHNAALKYLRAQQEDR